MTVVRYDEEIKQPAPHDKNILLLLRFLKKQLVGIVNFIRKKLNIFVQRWVIFYDKMIKHFVARLAC